ncbi:ASCH domain-containing protein [Paenibacillus koleovorans]|uniref:ASCH domain-containing protein n=1 Tax=Paenibacillus koleovorans TaxID=121608 RepID=UPI000FDC43D3|nr:ASCH domain-containing protein [Paenibacillus koleovorans]
MKAITIHQPWATLIAIGAKQFETRSWATKYRGPIAIHAGKQLDLSAIAVAEIRETLVRHGYTHWNMLPQGVIATAELVQCWSIGLDYQNGMPSLYNGENGETRKVSVAEEKVGYYDFGRYAWQMDHVVKLPKPIAAKGQQGLWNWNND